MDHKVFQILSEHKDKLSSLEVTPEPSQPKSSKPKGDASSINEFYKKNSRIMEDLKLLFLYSRFMDWFPTIPVSLENPINFELLFSKEFYALDFWKSKHFSSYSHWDKIWENEIKPRMRCAKDWDKGQSFNLQSFSDSKKIYRYFISGFYIIAMFVSYFQSVSTPKYWKLVHSIHSWLIRPRMQKDLSESISPEHRYWIEFPNDLKYKYSQEHKKWDQALKQKHCGDILMDILDRYGHFSVESDLIPDNPFFSIQKKYVIRQPSLLSSQSKQDLGFIWLNSSKNGYEIIKSNLYSRKRDLFSRWIKNNEEETLSSISTSYTMFLWCLYGKFYPSPSGSPYVYQLKSLEQSLSLFAQYSRLNENYTKQGYGWNETSSFDPPYYSLIDKSPQSQFLWAVTVFDSKTLNIFFGITEERLNSIQKLIQKCSVNVKSNFQSIFKSLKTENQSNNAYNCWIISRFANLELSAQIFINHYLKYPADVPIKDKKLERLVKDILGEINSEKKIESLSESRLDQYLSSLDEDMLETLGINESRSEITIIGRDNIKMLVSNISNFEYLGNYPNLSLFDE